MFKKKEAAPANNPDKYPYFVFAKLAEQCPPVERGRRYEDPLSAHLERLGMGTITGGGCLLGDRQFPGEKDIIYAGIDIELANLSSALDEVKKKLNELGAPLGSEIEYTNLDGKLCEEPIGELEILNVFIDNVSLPIEVYEAADFKKLTDGLSAALASGKIGELRGPCMWDSEVLIYFAGKSAEAIFARIEPLRSDYPILQNARVVFQRRNEDNPPREIRLTFNSK